MKYGTNCTKYSCKCIFFKMSCRLKRDHYQSFNLLMKCIDKKSCQKYSAWKSGICKVFEYIEYFFFAFSLSQNTLIITVFWSKDIFEIVVFFVQFLSLQEMLFKRQGNELLQFKKGNHFIWKSVEFYYSVMLCLTDWVMKQMSMSTQKSALPALLKNITCTN